MVKILSEKPLNNFFMEVGTFLSGETSRLISMLPQKIPDKINLIKEGFILFHYSRAQSIITGKSQQQEVKKLDCTHSQEQRTECLCLAHFLLLVQSGAPAHGMVPTLRVKIFPPQLTSSI